MHFINWFQTIDKKICKYFGLDKERLLVQVVSMEAQEVAITYTIPFKRHTAKLSWHDFQQFIRKDMNEIHLEKFGRAAGKALADNLVISFQEVQLKNLLDL